MMKKIFILLFIIGAISFIRIDLFASSHTTFYGYDLDTTYQELGNVSLREFFYDNNLNYQIYDSQSIGVSVSNNYLYFETSQYNYPYIYLSNGTTKNYFSSTNIYFWTYSIDITNSTNLTYFNIRGKSQLTDSGIKNYLGTLNSTDLYIQLRASSTGNTSSTFNADDFYIIDITSTGLQLSQRRLEFLFHVYKTLYERELSYDDGYDDGNLNGYDDGYDDGLFDYHTGNNYGQYDYTNSEPYDQATQANVSVLNIFSLIIGVVMSMIGFIINIEIFDISIASVLGTLAIGVSIVWLLKLIRG